MRVDELDCEDYLVIVDSLYLPTEYTPFWSLIYSCNL